MSAIAALLLIAVAAAPLASASHLTTMYTKSPLTGRNLDEGSGYVYEDDEEIAQQPGTNLHELRNRVTRNLTDGVGTGHMIMDTQYFFGDNPYINPNYYAEPLIGGRHIFPGNGHFITFFGWWDDKNNDGIIQLWHDADNHDADEFKWRGTASGETDLSIVFFVIPTTTVMGNGRVVRTTPGSWHNESNPNANGQFADRTGFGETQQKWVLGLGHPVSFYDEGFLMTTQTISVGNASRLPGNPQIVDVLDKEALIDVDTYAAVSPEVDLLWWSSSRFARDQANAALAAANAAQSAAINAYNEHVFPTVNDTRNDAVAIVGEINEDVEPILEEHVDPHVDEILALYSQVIAAYNAVQRQAFDEYFDQLKLIAPDYLKEPNHLEDDYEGRATLGAGDVLGTGNTYLGYENGFGLWFDAFADTQIGYITNVQVDPLNFAYGYYGTLLYDGIDPFPSASGNPNEERGSGALMSMRAVIGVWHDKNKDSWIGILCDPENPEAWDSENNRCRNDPSRRFIDDTYPQRMGRTAPVGGWGEEFYGTCGVTKFEDGVVTLTPVGGAWPMGTVVIRNYDTPTSNIWRNNWVHVGGTTTAIELNWDYQCAASAFLVRSVDQVLFPRGNTGIGIRTESTVTLAKFKDPVTELEMPSMTVTDVDHYHPSM